TATTSDLACRWLPVAATACSSKPTSHASLSSVCSTTGWTTSVTSKLTPGLTGTGESTQAARLSSSTARNQGTTRFQLAKFRGHHISPFCPEYLTSTNAATADSNRTS